jgi:hypothetical protein
MAKYRGLASEGRQRHNKFTKALTKLKRKGFSLRGDVLQLSATKISRRILSAQGLADITKTYKIGACSIFLCVDRSINEMHKLSAHFVIEVFYKKYVLIHY